MIIGTFKDGRKLDYDESIYQFSIDGVPIGFSDVKAQDDASNIDWNIPEQHDWFRSLSEHDITCAHDAALEAHVVAETSDASMTDTQASNAQPAFGESPYVPSTDAQPQYAQPAFSQPPYAQPAYAQSSYAQPESKHHDGSGAAIIVAVVLVFLLALACALLFAFVFIPKITGSVVIENDDGVISTHGTGVGHPLTETQVTEYLVDGESDGTSLAFSTDEAGYTSCTLYR